MNNIKMLYYGRIDVLQELMLTKQAAFLDKIF